MQCVPHVKTRTPDAIDAISEVRQLTSYWGVRVTLEEAEAYHLSQSGDSSTPLARSGNAHKERQMDLLKCLLFGQTWPLEAIDAASSSTH
jgi:hypothetical protein